MRHVVHTEVATAVALVFLGAAGAAFGAGASDASSAMHDVASPAARVANDEAFMRQAAAADAEAVALGEVAQHKAADKTVHNEAGLKAAKDATGATGVAAERTEHMPVPKTGM